MPTAVEAVDADSAERCNTVATLGLTAWGGEVSAPDRLSACKTLERGDVLWLPQLPFAIEPAEQRLFEADLEARAKNISLAPGAEVRGTEGSEEERKLLHGLLKRYADSAALLLQHLLPSYHAAARVGRTSFRPAEIEGRAVSWRKDDTRLHVDSFPSSPTGGWRILRVFANVNPQGKPRTWRIGETFETVARRFVPGVRPPLPGSAAFLHALGVTKQRRSAYDHFMLALHDRMKADLAYQQQSAQQTCRFPAGTSWLVFTDQASHAAMSGQYALEQTFLVPVAALHEPARSPLRVLEGIVGRALL